MRDEIAAGAKEPIAFRAFGTWNALPAILSLVQQYEAVRHSPAIDFTPMDSDQTIDRMFKYNRDVGMPFDSFVAAKSPGQASQCRCAVIARFVVAVAVNVNNPTHTLTLAQLRQTFTWQLIPYHEGSTPPPGGITSWKDLDRSAAATHIDLVRPPALNPSSLIFRNITNAKNPFTDAITTASRRQRQTDTAVMPAIAEEPNSIGFFFCPRDAKPAKGVRILAIAKDEKSPAFIPTASSIADGTYPLMDALAVYVRPGAPPAADDFCSFAAGPESAEIFKHYGLWPEFELNVLRGQQRLAELKAGKAATVNVSGAVENETLAKDLAMKYALAEEAVQVKFRGQGPGVGGQEKAEIRIQNADREGAARTPVRQAHGEQALSQREREKAALGQGASEKERRLVIGRRAVGVVANPKTHLTSLMLDELRQIRDGKIKNWPGAKDVGPAIHVYGVRGAENVGALRGEKASETAGIRFAKDSQQVVLAVARDPAGIGFVDLSEIPADDKSVVMLGISGNAALTPALSQREREKDKPIMPSAGNVPDDYPLQEPVLMYMAADAGPAAVRFADWIAKHPDAETLAQHHLIPAAGTAANAEGERRKDEGGPGPLPAGEAERNAEVASLLPSRPSMPAEPDEAKQPIIDESPAADSKPPVAGVRERAKSLPAHKMGGVPSAPGRLAHSAKSVVAPSAAETQSASPEESQSGQVILWIAVVASGIFGIVIALSRLGRPRPASRRKLSHSAMGKGDQELSFDIAGIAAGASQDAATGADQAFDPYHRWLGIPPAEQPPNDYRLLGLALFESDPEVISHAADARMAHLRTYQLGPLAALSQELLNEVASARVRLTSATKKGVYDARLRRQFSSPR